MSAKSILSVYLCNTSLLYVFSFRFHNLQVTNKSIFNDLRDKDIKNTVELSLDCYKTLKTSTPCCLVLLISLSLHFLHVKSTFVKHERNTDICKDNQFQERVVICIT